ncbi:MAG: hypothetical protein GTO53_08090, partial [Planctomycetales bacterium]|nr:hypothetical protein [Planctomycetales bacterium]NIM09093.1 hypothetical protein [Planctomycetales bacterium]NIN08553.1 hypothetical protein [Planctomycetales bacterium]NIN77686.1 hypothetical protein [Planctomycetales bacterium]NIO34851.1 hypothetical protein [Planctomycetales bacterium]
SADHDRLEEKALEALQNFQQEHADDPDKLAAAQQTFDDQMDFLRKRHAAHLTDLTDDTVGVDVVYT